MASGATAGVIERIYEGKARDARLVDLPDGGWIAVYEVNNGDGGFGAIFAERFDSAGNSLGESVVNQFQTGRQHSPEVTVLADGGWVITWTSRDQDGDAQSVIQRSFFPDGSPRGDEIVVNTYSTDDQTVDSITALNDGGWVVTWTSAFQDAGDGDGVYQQRYDADGAAVGGETLVNTGTSESQRDSDSLALADGGWVVSWTGTSMGFDEQDLFFQRYDADGQPVGGQARINIPTPEDSDGSIATGIQGDVQMIAMADGGWLAVYYSSEGIVSQRFERDGARVGGETRVSVNSSGFAPEVAALADGGWVIVWVSGGIRQQRFDADGNLVGGETVIPGTRQGYSINNVSVAGLADGTWVVSWEDSSINEIDGNPGVWQVRFAPDIEGTAGDDQLIGTANAETIIGFDGADTLIGNGGDDVLIGGRGDDTYIVNAAGDDVRELLDQGYDTVVALVDYSIARDAVEALNLQGSADIDGFGNSVANLIDGTSGANDLFGYNGDDELVGREGADVLNGGAGHDLLDGGDGNDRLAGGSGRDTASYRNAGGGVTVSLAITSTQNTGGAGTDTLADVENLLGSAFADTLTGDDGDNVIEGGAGNDTLSGLLGVDTVSYAGAAAGVVVRLGQAAAQNTGGAGTDTLSGFENVTGSSFDDNLAGNADANVIDGGAGNDVIDGNGGIDTASYAASSLGVQVDLALGGAQNTLGGGNDTLSSIENLVGSRFLDSLRGNAFANQLDGGAGNDFLEGRDGADKLIGGLGRDTLTGGAGADRFIFDDGDMSRTRTGADAILDFTRAEGDRIALSQIDADRDTAGDQAFTFIFSSAFSGTVGELRYFNDLTNTFIEGDTDGDGLGDFLIRVDGIVFLQGADFIL